jgi:hypothetical protein
LTQVKVKEQLVVRNDMDVAEHERLSSNTLRYKLKLRNSLWKERKWIDSDKPLAYFKLLIIVII